ncbi:MAG TPA: bifunctional transaldolase/phosoglucose isomerase [Candidatus Acidoferrales bacterium]|nr:bifunctional transaldolase/phosoglucose isomerase [Candidatus Acidoferrales bacterium]
MSNPLAQLADCGQSIWLDYIRRNMFGSGELRRLIDLGLRGMTSNPTIFEKAIGAGSDYDEQLRSIAGTLTDPNEIFEALAIQDIRSAADAFRPLYESTHGADGFVSLEVSPLLAHDTAGTIASAKRLWAAVDRPNVMIKIPGTPEGVPAITEVIGSGINVNVTLIFAVDAYEATAQAYIAGLELLAQRGGSVDRIASVNSVFVSRIDTAVDKLLQEKVGHGEPLQALMGKTGLANLKMIYQAFKKLFGTERFAALRAKGAHVQRPLWASTGTKNPAYSDLLYVENTVGKETVNTVPPATLEALLDHLHVRRDSIEEDLDGAHSVLAEIAKAQISLYDVTQKLQADGVKSFADSYNAMLKAIEYKIEQLRQRRSPRVEIDLAKAQIPLDAAIASLAQNNFLQKLWSRDPSAWSADATHAEIIKHALGWLDFPEHVLEQADDLTGFAKECAKRFDHVVVLGMGGSSLAPDVLRATFGKVDGFPQLHVLDSSDPAQVKTLENALDLTRSLFIVASKSGTTTEPDAFMRYFFERVQKVGGAQNAGQQFIAITDPATALVEHATRLGFRRIFLNDPDIGGRYSALSFFGMVPAALAGYDVKLLLDRGIGGLHSNARTTPVEQSDGVRFGAAIGTLAKRGRDKLTIVAHPSLAAYGTWCEQLIAESTGKSGVGIVPIEGETLGLPHEYSDDRLFVYVGEGLPPGPHITGQMDAATIALRLETLASAGHPVIRLSMNDVYDIGEQFALWEIATATAGAVLGIDPFDQPNVQESKDNTKRLLAEYAKSGAFSEPAARLRTPSAQVIPLAGSAGLSLGDDLGSALAAVVSQVRPGDYIAITAYIEMNHEHQIALREIRLKLRNALRTATTIGFGPRFLHSTGQLHKGGPPTGVFLQLTADPAIDLPIPGMVSFKTLERAQALGDFESLDKRGRRGVRLHLTAPLDQALEALSTAVDDAVAAKA